MATDGKPFPLAVIFRPWKHTSGQISFLKWAVCAPKEVFDFSHAQRLVEMEDTRKCDNYSWACIDLVSTLLVLAEFDESSVRAMFENPLQYNKELLLINLVQNVS